MRRSDSTVRLGSKPVIIALVVIFLLLQYELWFGAGGIVPTMKLHHSISKQQHINQQLKQRNTALQADIHELKMGDQAVEERARRELGMVKKHEHFYQIIKSDS